MSGGRARGDSPALRRYPWGVRAGGTRREETRKRCKVHPLLMERHRRIQGAAPPFRDRNCTSECAAVGVAQVSNVGNGLLDSPWSSGWFLSSHLCGKTGGVRWKWSKTSMQQIYTDSNLASGFCLKIIHCCRVANKSGKPGSSALSSAQMEEELFDKQRRECQRSVVRDAA